MLSIRMQRTGRSGHAQFRVIVQDSRFHPTRGKVIAYIGNYDPHTKAVNIDKEQAAKYLQNGAQPSNRVAIILKREGVALPDWVKISDSRNKTVKNSEKLRKHRPVEEAPKEAEEPAAAEEEPETPVAEAVVEETATPVTE